MTSADSDFPCPQAVSDGLIDFVSHGYFLYGPKMGFQDVKVAISRYFKEQKNEDVSPDKLLIVDSAARGMYITAKALLSPGDEVLIFDPVDFLFTKSALAAQANVVRFPAIVKDDHIDLSTLEDYITPKTRMIGLCNPHNPLGTIYREEDLRLIAELSDKYDLYIMNDEIWSDIVYEPNRFLSMLSIEGIDQDRIVTVYGFSKTFAIAGLRIGCLHTSSQAIFNALVESSDVMSTAGGATTISQIAAKICVDECVPHVQEYVSFLKQNRDYITDRLSKMPLIDYFSPQATFLIFPSIKKTGLNSADFSKVLEDKYNLAVVPGTADFFGPRAEGHIRISFSTSREIITEGMNRLEMALTDLSKG